MVLEDAAGRASAAIRQGHSRAATSMHSAAGSPAMGRGALLRQQQQGPVLERAGTAPSKAVISQAGIRKAC